MQTSLSFRATPALLAGALLATFAAAQDAPSRRATAGVYAQNTLNASFLYALDYHESEVGAAVSSSATHSFSGLDRDGSTQTMTFTGTSYAQSQYGRLRAAMSVSLTNSYYNPENPIYYNGATFDPNGSPDDVSAISFASFTDRLQFGGEALAGYTARYVFYVDGTKAGDESNVALLARIGPNPTELLFAQNPGGYRAEYLTTQSYAIDGTFAQTATFDFTTQRTIRPRLQDDGTDTFASADYSATAVLSEVQVFDPAGNRVTNVTAVGDSGTVYNTQPVPEPTALAALGLGALALLRRRAR